MKKKKAQASTEYLLITGFILVAVTLIFSYAYISNNQNIKISQTSTALDKMVNAADIVYALGPGNIQYVEVTFPQGIEEIYDITVCNEGVGGSVEQGSNKDCGDDGADFGAIKMELELFGGNTVITRGSKAELELDGTIPVKKQIQATTGVHRIKVDWCDSENNNKICLKSA